MLLLFKGLIVQFIVIMILVIIDFLFAVSVALKYGKFDWKKFLNYLKCDACPYILIWAGLSIVSVVIPLVVQWLSIATLGLEEIVPIGAIVTFVWGTLIFKIVASIKDTAANLGIEIKNNK